MQVDVIYNEECLAGMAKLPADSIDAVVTDPPYGLAFMGKKWDYDVPSVEIWRAVLRVLKPGGHVLSFGGTRTYHRMVVNLEDAGFEIRDSLAWLYGSGFPKSLDVGKSIDKQAGAKREIIGTRVYADGTSGHYAPMHEGYDRPSCRTKAEQNIPKVNSAPATKAAKQWDGWGTALKPAVELICLARNPTSEQTIAANVLKHGTGGLNIDGCRIETEHKAVRMAKGKPIYGGNALLLSKTVQTTSRDGNIKGRWPANLLLDQAAAEMLDEQSGILHSQSPETRSRKTQKGNQLFGNNFTDAVGKGAGFGDSGGASRFFYCAKASKSERGEGNTHPTVKPLKLMEYLVRLVTPPNGVVLDLFMGSGSTALACIGTGCHYIGFEKDPKYFQIAQQRIA